MCYLLSFVPRSSCLSSLPFVTLVSWWSYDALPLLPLGALVPLAPIEARGSQGALIPLGTWEAARALVTFGAWSTVQSTGPRVPFPAFHAWESKVAFLAGLSIDADAR
jgi:hypothetical protein